MSEVHARFTVEDRATPVLAGIAATLAGLRPPRMEVRGLDRVPSDGPGPRPGGPVKGWCARCEVSWALVPHDPTPTCWCCGSATAVTRTPVTTGHQADGTSLAAILAAPDVPAPPAP